MSAGGKVMVLDVVVPGLNLPGDSMKSIWLFVTPLAVTDDILAIRMWEQTVFWALLMRSC